MSAPGCSESLDLLDDITPISEAAALLRTELVERGFSEQGSELMAMEFWRAHCEECLAKKFNADDPRPAIGPVMTMLETEGIAPADIAVLLKRLVELGAVL